MEQIPKKYEIKLYHKYRKEFGLAKDYRKRDKEYRERIQKTFFYYNDYHEMVRAELLEKIITPFVEVFNQIKKFLHIK